MSPAEIAAYVSLLGTLGGGSWIVVKALLEGKGSRERRLDQREEIERLEMEQENRLLRASYAALFGVLQVMVDHLIVADPANPTLDALALNLKIAFPVPAEMPPDMAAMMRRIDGRPKPGSH